MELGLDEVEDFYTQELDEKFVKEHKILKKRSPLRILNIS